MFVRTISALSMAFATLAPISSAYAQGTVALVGDVKVVKIVQDADGSRETLAEPTSVVPGDRIVFTTKYNTETGSKVENFVISNPLPKAVVLTAAGEFTVSIDNGKTFAALGTLTASEANGTSRPAELSDVTDIRWTIDSIAPGASGEVNYFAAVR